MVYRNIRIPQVVARSARTQQSLEEYRQVMVPSLKQAKLDISTGATEGQKVRKVVTGAGTVQSVSVPGVYGKPTD